MFLSFEDDDDDAVGLFIARAYNESKDLIYTPLYQENHDTVQFNLLTFTAEDAREGLIDLNFIELSITRSESIARARGDFF